MPLQVQNWFGTGCQKITDELSSIPESLPVTNKDLPDLASISPSDPFMGHLGICAHDLMMAITISV